MLNYFPAIKKLNVPNILTSLSISLGFIGVILIVENHIKLGITLYSITMLLDRLDGLAARLLKQQSDFGKELDSLADCIVFCFIPGFIAYQAGFNSIGAVVVILLYILAGVWRLAYFNLTGMSTHKDTSCFTGFPTTNSASYFVIVYVLNLIFTSVNLNYFFIPFFISAALLMLGAFKFPKNSIFTNILYVLVPAALICMWIF